jgi:hypothetical protein
VRAGLPVLQGYEEYTLQVLNFYYYLCKQRNQKSMMMLESKCRFTEQFILRALECFDKDHLRYYRSFINLYNCLLLEQEPLVRISLYNNNVYLM